MSSGSETLRAIGLTWNPTAASPDFHSNILLRAGLYSVDTSHFRIHTLVASGSHRQPIEFVGYDPTLPQFSYLHIADFSFHASFTGALDPTVDYAVCVTSNADYGLYYAATTDGQQGRVIRHNFTDGLPSIAFPTLYGYSARLAIWLETAVASPTNYYGFGFPGDDSSVFVSSAAASYVLFCSQASMAATGSETLQSLGVT